MDGEARQLEALSLAGRRMQESGQPGDSSSARLEADRRGNPKVHTPVTPKDGEARQLEAPSLASRRMQDSGQPGDSSSERLEVDRRGNPKVHTPGAPKDGEARQLEALSLASRRMQDSGNLRTHQRRDWKRIGGATRRFTRQ